MWYADWAASVAQVVGSKSTVRSKGGDTSQETCGHPLFSENVPWKVQEATRACSGRYLSPHGMFCFIAADTADVVG